MEKGNELKALIVKKHNPELYEKVIAGEINLQDAYNEAQRQQLGLSEFRGRSTKKKDFSTDFKRMMQLHQPTIEDALTELKKAFPYTYKDFLKD